MKYLVPFDFTSITKSALHHALGLAEVTDAKVELLHIVPKGEDIRPAEGKLRDVIATISEKHQSRLHYKVRQGDIFTDIAAEAEAEGVSLLVMGTHGAKGLQKLFGSHAMKVVTSSKTPFIITQEKGPTEAIDIIVMPVDLTKESVRIVNFAAEIAKQFDAEVHLVYAAESDEWLEMKLKVNTGYAKKELQKADVKFEVHELPNKRALHTF